MRLAFFLSVLAMLFVGIPAYAAHVYLDAPSEVNRLDTFYVPIRIDLVDECMNSARVSVAYDPAVLSIRDVAVGRSILTLWTEEPLVEREEGAETGRIWFEGGVPGGYCGRVVGDPGLTNILAELVVTGVQGATESTARLILEPDTALYAHDGLGTKLERTTLGAELSLLDSSEAPYNVWLADVSADTQAPEYFDVTLVPGPSDGNQYSYIIFSTTDKQSGVDHYEVRETDPNQFGILSWVGRPSYWIPAKSPYVLRDQRLHSTIQVKAVDKNGNERVVEYTPPMSPLARYTTPVALTVLTIGLVILTILVIGWSAVHARKRRKVQPIEERVTSEDEHE